VQLHQSFARLKPNRAVSEKWKTWDRLLFLIWPTPDGEQAAVMGGTELTAVAGRAASRFIMVSTLANPFTPGTFHPGGTT
jgi:hypothetical protein